MVLSPREIFEVTPIASFTIFDVNLTITNTLFYSLLAVTLRALPFLLERVMLVPSRLTVLLEATIATLSSIVSEQIGSNRTYYLPFAYSLFFFILVTNLFGNVPYNYTVGTSLIVTRGRSFTIWFATTILAASKHGLHFFSFFVPSGTPIALVPMLSLIELISYISRAISLGVRLRANRVSGHRLRNIISTFIFNGRKGFLRTTLRIAPIVRFCALVGLEIAVSFIQAFVFTMLTRGYLKDAIDLH